MSFSLSKTTNVRTSKPHTEEATPPASTMITVGPSSDQELENIAYEIGRSQRVAVIIGAGISTTAGIPDFRSAGGLYAKGDLFSEAAIYNEASRRRLRKSALQLYRLAKSSKPTRAHEAIKDLHNAGQLLRCYTQNIDMLEVKAGLSTDLDEDKGPICVQLHGSVRLLRCTCCFRTFPMEELEVDFSEEDDLPCPQCTSYTAAREAAGRRRLPIGILLPDIVRTGQHYHPSGEAIAHIMCRDQAACPDFLLILGTSLTPDGPKTLAKGFAREVRRSGGTVVYVNLTEPRAVWGNHVDYWVKWDCDNWAQDLEERRLALPLRDNINRCTPGSSFDSPIIID